MSASRSGGFTLIELLIASAIMVGVIGSSYAVLVAGYQTRLTVEQRSDALQQARAALELIAADLRHAAPTSPELLFVGIDRTKDDLEADNLDFVTHLWRPHHFGEGDLCEVSYFLDREVDAERLALYRRRDASPDLESFDGGSRELIASGVTLLRFEYYDGFDWLDRWGSEDGGDEFLPPLSGAMAGDDDGDGENPDELGGGGEEFAPDPYVPGQSGLPEAVRITIALADLSDEEESDKAPWVTAQLVVRPALVGRLRTDPTTAGPMLPGAALDAANGAPEIDGDEGMPFFERGGG